MNFHVKEDFATEAAWSIREMGMRARSVEHFTWLPTLEIRRQASRIIGNVFSDCPGILTDSHI